jgi:hypothetical protein
MQAPILLAILEYGLLMAMKRLWPKKTTVDVMKETPNRQGVYQKVAEKTISRFVKTVIFYSRDGSRFVVRVGYETIGIIIFSLYHVIIRFTKIMNRSENNWVHFLKSIFKINL